VALAEGRADEARLRLEEAAARLGALDAPAEHAAALAWLGAAAQARGDLATAEALSAEAAAILEAGLFSQDFPPQDVWWMRHRALAASAPGSEAAQAALRRAYATMQGGIASLSDAGLRRNYLNKVQINRQIVEGWSRQVGAATPEPAANDDPRDQLARMLQISAQMNERREDAALRQFILDQLVELSGAERALLALAEDEERVELLARGVPPEQMDAFAAEAQQALDQVRGTRRALLRHQVPAAAGSEDEPAPLRLRSQLCLPLVAGGRLIGALYADNREAFGRFAQADLDLLTVLATQAATALRNVGLYNEILRANVELEQRVAERTASLERRVAELAIVNRIGQAVASQLELDALIELVGTTMLETFRAQNVYVALYDAASEQISFPYDVENGQRISSSSLRFGAGLTSEILLTRRPLLLNGEAEMRAAGLRIASIGARARSFLGVPILVGEKPIGVISVQNTERDGAFSEADVRLLSTIAASVGVALENARLYQETRRMQQAAEAASVAKSTFLANMSHELRTPLNAVLGFAQLMANDSGLGARQHEHLGIISRSGEHLLGLINDVLEMSKIEAGRVTLNPAPFELPRLLQGVQEMFALRAEAKGLWMRFELAPGLPRYVLGDEGKLRQLIINLLGNAVKFTHSGGVTLRAARGEGVLLAFEIEDTGEGIAPEQLPSLFQPFVQTASGLRSQEGTGLGLAIARQFAQLMGGDISVSSEPGVGSLFRFEAELPPIRGDNPGVAARVERRVIGLAPDERQDYRVLVVDDKWENRHLLCEWLAGVGIEVREAADGAEALAIWEQWDPQLIWMDLRMPVLDGYEAIRRIKATTRGQATAVIALTASTFEQERDVTLSTGCDDFVRKPVREATIFAKLSQHLGIRFVYDEAAPGAHDTLLPPRAHDLAALPAALRAALREAVDEMDVEAARELAGQAALHSPALAQALAALLDEFRFDVLDQLLNESEQA
jgi:signal transduction histidine kinase/DNA-binding NarL/FixJ family response regulator